MIAGIEVFLNSWKLYRFPIFLRRYRTTLSAIVALTSTPTRTKPPQAADLVPPSSTTTYELLRIPPQVAGSVSGHHKPTRRAKTMVPHLHSVLRVPDLHAGAGAGQRHHAPQPDVSSSAHPCSQTTRMPEHAILRAGGSSKAAMQAPGGRKAHVSRCLGRRRTSYLRAFPFCVHLMRPGSSKDAVSLPRCHGSPGKHRAATNSSIAGSSALRAMTCMLQPFRSSPQWAGPCTDICAVVF